MAIVNEVMRIKSREDRRTLRERYLFITYLHEKHLSPLGALVDVGGEMEQRAAELIAVARHGRQVMQNDPVVPELTTKIIASVRRLKDEAWQDFHSSLREVTPLFRQIRRDHAFAVAISKQLDKVAREGLKGLDAVDNRLQISRWRADNLFNTYVLEDYLAGVSNYVANPEAGPLASFDQFDKPPMLDFGDVSDQLVAAGKQHDLLEWLISSFGSYPDQQILQAFQGIADSPTFQCAPGEAEAKAETSEAIYSYHPIRTEFHDRTV
ncbi:MAG: hypothetical protein IPP85_09835 [Propionivibrio sp.]|nr:hypothetical protein [Propionivibrio sp.]